MRRLLALLSVALLLAAPAIARADSFTPAQRDEIVKIVRDALKQDPTILRDALIALQSDEDHHHEQALSDAIDRNHNALYSGNDQIEGDPRAPLAMIEFYDTRCPYCRRMLPVMAELLRDEPHMQLVLKDLPILGPTSLLESRALLAAKRQGGYLKMRDALMQSSAPSTPASLHDLAQHLGLDADRVLRDMDDPAIKAQLEANVALAQTLGVQGTPAIIVGKHMIAGAADLNELRGALNTARGEN